MSTPTKPQYRPAERIDRVYLYATATPAGAWLLLDEIDRLERAAGALRRSDAPLTSAEPRLLGIRYTQPRLRWLAAHYYVHPSGAVDQGRHACEIPGLPGIPATALAVALVGSGRYTAAQWASLCVLLRGRPARGGYPAVPGVVEAPLPLGGLPGFDVAAWVAADYQPLPGHLLEEGAP